MLLCKHNRKAWKCRLCKSEEARAYSVALNDADIALTSSNALANKSVREFGPIQEPLPGNLLTVFSDCPQSFGQIVAKEYDESQLERLRACPVPKAMFDKDMEPFFWEQREYERGKAYILRFKTDTLDHCYYQQLVWKKDVDSFIPREYHSETKEGRDSDYLIHLMESLTGKRLTLTAGTSMIEEFLTQRYGKPYSLNGPPSIGSSPHQLTFPTTRGIKYINSRDFKHWLYQYGQYTQAAGRVLRDITKRAINQGINNLIFPHTIPAKDSLVHVRHNCTINIEHACTINLNGNIFHVRQEGDRMMLLDKNMRRLS